MNIYRQCFIESLKCNTFHLYAYDQFKHIKKYFEVEAYLMVLNCATKFLLEIYCYLLIKETY